MAEDSNEDSGEVKTGDEEETKTPIKRTDDLEEKRGVTATILLAVPLLIKFVIVLAIKIATDLVVLPLLLLYRLVRLAKRRFLKLIGKEAPQSP